MNALVGKKVVAVHLAEDKTKLRFDIEGDKPMFAFVDADCCSETYIESVETPENLIGVVLQVEDIDMPDLGLPATRQEVVSYYGCKIHTEKGSCLVDYRNESNGYYGGSLVWPGDYGYERKQTVENKWQKIA